MYKLVPNSGLKDSKKCGGTALVTLVSITLSLSLSLSPGEEGASSMCRAYDAHVTEGPL